MFRTLLFAIVMQAAAPAAAPDTAVVRVGNRVVAVLRSPALGLSPAERAEGARRRLDAAVSSGADSVSSQAEGIGTIILVGGRGMFVLTPGDVDTLGGVTMEQEVATTKRRLHVALGEAREARSVRALVRGAFATAVATVLLIVALTLGWRVQRRLSARGERLAARLVPRIRIGDLELLSPARAERAVRWGG